MSTLEEQLLYETEWRVNEITTLKTVPFLYLLTDEQKKVLQKYSIPSIYSLWEGFVAESFSLYIKELNQLNLTTGQISKIIITNDLDTRYKLSDGRKNFEKKVSLVNNIYCYISSSVNLSTNISTQSNVNFNVINQILSRFNLELLPENPFRKNLDKLVFIRNNIAHGRAINPMEQRTISDLSIVAIDVIYEVFNRIIDGYRNKTYLENSFD